MQSAWYKNKIVLGVVLIVVVALGLVLFGGDKAPKTEGGVVGEVTETTNVEPKTGEIAVTGKLGCTPLKSGAQPSADQCVLGLVGSDGKFYALETSKIEMAESGIEPNSTIKVVGVYTKIDAASEEAGVFKYGGVVAVRLMVINK